MVTRTRVQGETMQILAFPGTPGATSVFAVFKGPSGLPVSAQGVRTQLVVGAPWLVGPAGWFLGDFGAFPALGAGWKITQDTSAFVPGQWAAEIWTVANSIKNVLTKVSFGIEAALANGGANDSRSVAQRIVDNIEAYMANPQSVKASSYKIGERELARYSYEELLRVLRYWRNRVRAENLKAEAPHGRIGKRINVTL